MKARIFFLALSLAGCAVPRFSETITEETPAPQSSQSPQSQSPQSPQSDGKFYLDDGPPDVAPAGLENIPDAIPKVEEVIAATTRPYTALGERRTPHRAVRPYREKGIASWYGKRYHGRATASGETYDMFKMTAAHPVLAIPSYARVTRTDTGKSVVVRINDRGPFLHGRVIDLSYAAAYRLGIAEKGSGEVVVEAIVPGGESRVIAPPQTPVRDSADDLAAQQIYIQLGAFSVAENAERMQAKFRAETPSAIAHKIYSRDGLFLFLIGPYRNESSARADDNLLCAAGWCGFFTRAP